jgi:protease IV
MPARRGAVVLIVLLGVLGAFALFVTLVFRHSLPTFSGSNLLVLDVPSYLDEGPRPLGPYPFSIWSNRTTVWDVESGIRRAAEDDRIVGLVLHVDDIAWGWAKAAEVRDALLEFKQTGKPIYAHLSNGGEIEYLIAATAGTIATPPLGLLQLDGLSLSAEFYRGTLDKLGISPNFAHAGRYKSGVEEYTRTGMSGPAREAFSALVDDAFDVLVDSLASARSVSRDSMTRLIDDGPYDAPAAISAGLIDTVLYRAALDSLATRARGKRYGTIPFNRYVDDLSAPSVGPTIALVVAEGTIASGKSRGGPGQGEVLGSETFEKTMGEVERRSSIKAVVLRIDSPGGDAAAADEMWNAVRRCARRKPVIASLSDLAASGGYYVAVAADSIVSQPATITGSIGVYGGKFNLMGLCQKLGLNVESISRGRNSEMLSPFKDFSPDEIAHFQSRTDYIYRTFLTRVSEGRHLDLALTDSIAQGRVWSGTSAKAIGLVDAFGGIEDAIGMARARLGVPAGQSVAIERYPRVEYPFLQQLFMDFVGRDEDAMFAGVRLPTVVAAWLTVAQFTPGSVLALMPYNIEIR